MNLTTEKNRLCKLNAILELIEYAEIRLRNFEEFRERAGMFVVTRKMTRNNEFTRLAKERLENYYTNLLIK